MTMTAKIKVMADDGQAGELERSMHAYRQACNYVSARVHRDHDLAQASLNKKLYRDLRSLFGLKSQMAQSAIKTVIARYKAVFESDNDHKHSDAEWPRPRFRKPQLDLVWNRDYSLNADAFSVNTISGRVKLPYESAGMERYFDHGKYRFGTAKLVYRHGKFFLHIPVTFDVGKCLPEDICNVVGVDRGVNFVVATYDSQGSSGFVSGKRIKQARAKYAQVRKSLQRRQTPSARRRLKAIGNRENRWMQDVNHCISKALVENNPDGTLFVLEDLTGIRAKTERVNIRNRYTQVSWSFYDLEQKLAYKAALAHSMVIKVDPAYTSQSCPKCGHTERGNRDKKRHVFCCKKCGYTSNDDRIAAMNLHRKGIEYLVPSAVTPEHALA